MGGCRAPSLFNLAPPLSPLSRRPSLSLPFTHTHTHTHTTVQAPGPPLQGAVHHPGRPARPRHGPPGHRQRRLHLCGPLRESGRPAPAGRGRALGGQAGGPRPTPRLGRAGLLLPPGRGHGPGGRGRVGRPGRGGLADSQGCGRGGHAHPEGERRVCVRECGFLSRGAPLAARPGLVERERERDGVRRGERERFIFHPSIHPRSLFLSLSLSLSSPFLIFSLPPGPRLRPHLPVQVSGCWGGGER